MKVLLVGLLAPAHAVRCRAPPAVLDISTEWGLPKIWKYNLPSVQYLINITHGGQEVASKGVET